jgi:hypothetical protein
MQLRLFTAIVFGLALSAAASAQDANPAPPAQNQQPGAGGGWQGRRGGGWGGGMGQGRGVMGTVTDVAADHYTIKTETGELYAVHFSANTRIVKAPERRRGEGGAGAEGGSPPQQIKPTDIKVGDAITAGGELDANAKSVGAVFIALIDPEQAQRMREMEASFGKTWLAGKVTAIDGVKVTLQGGPGNATHTFVADENTTFRKRRDPITLADVQVGDTVRVEGSVKDGAFLAASVGVMGMQGPPPGTAPGTAQGPPPGGPR